MSIGRELQRQQAVRDQRKVIPTKVYSEKSGGAYQDPANHYANKDAHHNRDHAATHKPGGVDPLSPSDIGAARIFRQVFDSTDTIVVTHNIGQFPIIQVIEDAAGRAFGSSTYGSGVYGGVSARGVITPTSITHTSKYQCTIVLPSITSGEVICCG